MCGQNVHLRGTAVTASTKAQRSAAWQQTGKKHGAAFTACGAAWSGHCRGWYERGSLGWAAVA